MFKNPHIRRPLATLLVVLGAMMMFLCHRSVGWRGAAGSGHHNRVDRYRTEAQGLTADRTLRAP